MNKLLEIFLAIILFPVFIVLGLISGIINVYRNFHECFKEFTDVEYWSNW